MATTATAQVVVANVGDSRALLIRDGKARNVAKPGGVHEAKNGDLTSLSHGRESTLDHGKLGVSSMDKK